MYEKTAFGAWLVVIMFLCTTAFASASPPVVLPSPDYLTKEQYSFYNKTLDCNSPTAISSLRMELFRLLFRQRTM